MFSWGVYRNLGDKGKVNALKKNQISIKNYQEQGKGSALVKENVLTLN